MARLRARADPFADEAAAVDEQDDDNNVVKGKTYVHVRVQQRNGRKSLTTVQARTLPPACLPAAPVPPRERAQ